MNKIKKVIVIHPILFGIFPVIFLFAHNIEDFLMAANSVVMPIIFMIVFTSLLWFLLSLIIKDRERAGLLVTVFLLMFFSYGPLYKVFAYLEVGGVRIGTTRVFMSLWGILGILGSYFILKTRRKLQGVSNYLNIVAVVLIVISLINIGIYKFKFKDNINNKVSAANEFNPGTLENKVELRDIYYIILDAYARNDTLVEIYNHDNNEFIDNLRSKGFFIATRSRSNYPLTALSIASTLQMEYVNYLVDMLGTKSRDYTALRNLVENNKVFQFLEQKGYKILTLKSFRAQYNKNSKYHLSILDKILLDDFLRLLLETTILDPFLSKLNDGVFRYKILSTFDRIEEIPNINEPTFLYAHILAPHDPYVFNSDGEETGSIEKVRLVGKDKMKQLYVGQLIYINKKINELIDKLLSKSDIPPIIILQSDHGPRETVDSWKNPSDTFLKERFRILNAYYLPNSDKDLLYNSVTPVNTFRIIFNQYFNAEYNLLEDKSYYSTYRYPYEFTDVTDKVY